MPTRVRSWTTSTEEWLILLPSISMSPVTLHPSIVSFMRLRHRKKVDLPHPDGPIQAVTSLPDTEMEMLLRAGFSP